MALHIDLSLQPSIDKRVEYGYHLAQPSPPKRRRRRRTPLADVIKKWRLDIEMLHSISLRCSCVNTRLNSRPRIAHDKKFMCRVTKQDHRYCSNACQPRRGDRRAHTTHNTLPLSLSIVSQTSPITHRIAHHRFRFSTQNSQPPPAPHRTTVQLWTLRPTRDDGTLCLRVGWCLLTVSCCCTRVNIIRNNLITRF